MKIEVAPAFVMDCSTSFFSFSFFASSCSACLLSLSLVFAKGCWVSRVRSVPPRPLALLHWRPQLSVVRSQLVPVPAEDGVALLTRRQFLERALGGVAGHFSYHLHLSWRALCGVWAVVKLSV